jgi:antitoxin (DNA-binding transcriptional repressor) of toxin-antitoxin stability system
VIQTVNIRALKDKLSSYLQRVQHGDLILVTDRGRVVAEIRSPTLSSAALNTEGRRAELLVEAGVLRRGLPNGADVYRPADISMKSEIVDGALEATRSGALER